ncbi:MAG: CpsB/CapC family capsule biosynthesis tyrosine phosphatase [Bacteroidota bacterium]
MFNFFKKNRSTDFASVKTDMHSHLIPGIDDGAQNIEESVHLIRGLMEMGYEKIITTPHIYQEYYPNTSGIIRSGLEKLKRHLQEVGIQIEIEAAAEYFLDEHFEQLVKADDILTFGNNNVLVEMSFYYETPKVFDYIFQLRSKGYNPILAHPERYIYYAQEFEKYEQFKDRGCLLQMNILSLLGYYGKPIQQNAMRLVKEDLVDLIGTDLHKDRQLQAIKAGLNNAKLVKLLERREFGNVGL